MKPRSLRRTFQEQNRFLFNQERSDYWHIAVLRTNLSPGTSYAIEHPLEEEGEASFKVILPRGGSRVRHIHIMGDSIPVFADGVVSHAGQPVALLMGRTKEDLKLLKTRVHVKILTSPEDSPTPVPGDVDTLQAAVQGSAHETLPPGVEGSSPGDALEPQGEVPELTEQVLGTESPAESDESVESAADSRTMSTRALENWISLSAARQGLYKDKTVSCGTPEAFFAETSIVQESTQHFADYPLHSFEPRGALAEWKEDLLTVSCSTSWPHLVRRCVSEATGLAQRHIKVISMPAHHLPDRFLLDSTLLSVWAAMGAMSIMGKAQIFLQSADDALWGTRTGSVDTVIQTAHDSDGRLLALRSMSTFNMGAWPCASDEILQMGLLGMCSMYRCPNQEHQARIVQSNEAPRFPPSLMGMNYTIQSMEQHVEHICRTFGHDSVIWRVQNILRKGDPCPYGTVMEQLVPPRLVLQSASLKSDFSRSHAALELQRGKYRMVKGTRGSLAALKGTGIALSFQSHGLLLSRELENRARLGLELSDDGHLTISAPMHMGNIGLREAWLAAVEESLGIEERNVSFARFSSQDLEDTGPARFSRVASIFSPILAAACTSLKKRIRSKKFPFAVQNTWARQKNMDWDEKQFSGTPFLGRSWAAAVVELSLDPVELAVEVRKVCVSIHGGAILHPARAEAHIRQSILSCLGWLGGNPENRVDGETFHARHNAAVPQIIINFENQDDPMTSLQKLAHAGAIGELVHGCVPAAYNNALCQITRTMPCSTPLSPDERSSIFMPATEGTQA